jgi:hypothetical protein
MISLSDHAVIIVAVLSASLKSSLAYSTTCTVRRGTSVKDVTSVTTRVY